MRQQEKRDIFREKGPVLTATMALLRSSHDPAHGTNIENWSIIWVNHKHNVGVIVMM